MSPSPYLTTAEAAARLRKTTGAFRSFKSRYNRTAPKRQQLRAQRIGGRLLFKVTDIDRLLQPETTAPVFERDAEAEQ